MAPVNKSAIASAFGRAAATYDKFADLQRLSGEALLKRTAHLSARQVLDAGCGTGTFSRRWREAGSRVTALDLSEAMLQQAQANHAAHDYVCGDIEALALPDARFCLVFSNLALQWCSDLHQGLHELLRVTRPGGHVAFSTLCEGSLVELNQAWQAVDGRAHANRFLSKRQIVDAAAGRLVDYHRETVTLHFADALSAMRSLKGIGATHLHDGRGGGLLTRRQLQSLSLAWPQQQGAYPLSYHLFYGVLRRD